ncbi:MurR/RpiR family transcriptional regulator [Paremcibacter congregatus]|uniref:MurR/RpiR family transcriptional regulator n=1 Tax=Paremcibacter congregatus TaxID=2043170 RepID=UPI003A911D6D
MKSKERTDKGNTESVMSVIRNMYEELSKSEKKVAEFLLQSPDRFINSSVKEVAQEVGVSEPTVVRFGRNAGCQGFKDLKIVLAQSLAVEQAMRDSGNDVRIQHDSASLGDVICNFATTIIRSAASELDAAILEEAAIMISQAQRLFIYGIGGSSSFLAQEAHNRFFRLNVTSIPFTDSYLQRMSASTMRSDDVALFISSTGRPRSLIDSAELAQHYGAKTVAITAPDSALARNVNVCLNVKLSQQGVALGQPNPMRFAQLFVLDCLAYRVAETLGDQAHESLDRVRASVAAMHGIVPQQPIGD